MTHQFSIIEAVALLKQGEVVAFPTETVYGLGADALNPAALKKIFQVKGRPPDHPLIVHIADLAQLKIWVKEISPVALQLAKHFWPGPMTLILSAADGVSPLITGGQSTIGIRMPVHPVARELLQSFKGAIAAPSANRFGRISPTAAAHVREEFGNEVKCILDGGACELGLESTIIDVTCDPPRLLRPGPLSVEVIHQQTGIHVLAADKQKPRVSGSLAQHYSPQTPLYLVASNVLRAAVIDKKNIAVISFQAKPAEYVGVWRQMSTTPEIYAHDLYAILREVDKFGVANILLELPPADISWQAIHDRLMRAACK